MPRLRKKSEFFSKDYNSAKTLCDEIVRHFRGHRDNIKMNKSYYYSMGKAARACRAGKHYDTVFYLMEAGEQEARSYRGRK
jgi:hypothetical protein